MSVSRDEVARIAALAAMRVDDDAMPELVRQMTRILDYVSQLAEVDAGTLSAFRPQSNSEPQALRTDVVMPQMGGFEFVRLFVEPDETTVLLEKVGVLSGT